MSRQGRHPLVVLFLGSNIGNFTPAEAGAFLARLRGYLRAGDSLLLGVDLVKPADVLEREKAIYVAQAKESGKPDAIVEKMVQGRVDKYFKEVTLLEQPWVRDPEKTINQVVAGTPGASVVRFVRFQMGEA